MSADEPFRHLLIPSLDATTEVLGCSRPTVVRHWRLAKGWLLRQLER
ncbi:MAG: hypothetical protein AAF560_15250 [Acidobacteriota bacterium]